MPSDRTGGGDERSDVVILVSLFMSALVVVPIIMRLKVATGLEVGRMQRSSSEWPGLFVCLPFPCDDRLVGYKSCMQAHKQPHTHATIGQKQIDVVAPIPSWMRFGVLSSLKGSHCIGALRRPTLSASQSPLSSRL